MSIISDAREIVSEESLKVFKQSRNSFISNLTKAINRAEMSLRQNPELGECEISNSLYLN